MRSSLFLSFSLRVVVALVCAAACCDPLAAQSSEATRVYSGHDWTSMQTSPGPATSDGWIDTKFALGPTQGSQVSHGRTYSVGATEVYEVVEVPPPMTPNGWFSLQPAYTSPQGWWGVPALPSHKRKVAIVQAVDTDQTILWQSYFYGVTPFADQNGYATHPRAIAVWPAETVDDVRVAICGETFDAEIPLSQVGPVGYSSHPTGFIAVYDGKGVLQWTHHMYGPTVPTVEESTVTDLSIRVIEIEGQKQDLVTYCGNSTYGLVTSGPMVPVAPFAAPTQIVDPLYVPAAGNSSNGVGGWDGFVGRLRHDRAANVTTTEFHSVVGGGGTDVLLGLAELDEYAFIAVGLTQKDTLTPAFPLAYPFTHCTTTSPLDWHQEAYTVGVASIFSTATLGTTGLQLIESYNVGSLDPTVLATEWTSETWTICHDVAASALVGGYTIVGGTNDSPGTQGSGDVGFLVATKSVLGSLYGATHVQTANGSSASIAGACDGFAIWCDCLSTPDVTVGIFGKAGPDVLTGVSTWGEYGSFAAFSGWEVDAVQRIRCGSMQQGSVVRDLVIPSSVQTHPAMSPGNTAMAPSTGRQLHLAELEVLWANGFNQRFLSCGGVTVDERCRLNVVGASLGGFPNTVPNFPSGRAPQAPFSSDAVRASVDTLPQGVSRTDGMGTRFDSSLAPNAWVPAPQPSGYNGGSTPTGSLSSPCMVPVGWRIGKPLGEVNRVQIDYLGAAPGNGVASSVVGQGYFGGPGGTLAALMQITLPPTAPLVIDTTEIWLWTGTPTAALAPLGAGWSYIEWALPNMVAGPLDFTVQVIWLLPASLTCDSSGMVASPGLVVSY